MKVKITRIQMYEIPSNDDESFIEFKDSFTDTVLDEQESEHETSDVEFTYIPREVIELKFEKIEEEKN